MGITIEDLPVEDLHPNPNNPRRQVGDVADLEASIRSQGIKQPLLVTPTGETDIDGRAQYRVVIGHRRLRRQTGRTRVRAGDHRKDGRAEGTRGHAGRELATLRFDAHRGGRRLSGAPRSRRGRQGDGREDGTQRPVRPQTVEDSQNPAGDA